MPGVESILAATQSERTVDADSVDVDVDLGDGTRLVGTVSGVRADVLLSLRFSSLSAAHRLRAWIDERGRWRSDGVQEGREGRLGQQPGRS